MIKKQWQQWESETDTAYHRFMIYLKLGPDRSISKVAETLQKGNGYAVHLRRWSSKYDWVDRCKAYDEHLALQYVENQEIIQRKARSKVLRRLPEAVDQLYKIALSDDHDRMEALMIILKLAGLNEDNEASTTKEQPTYQQINNYFKNLEN